MRTIILLAAILLGTGLAQAGGRLDQTWYDAIGEPMFMQSFDGGRNWYGWDRGRRLHYIEDGYGWASLWKGRTAIDADNVLGPDCSAGPFGNMECD